MPRASAALRALLAAPDVVVAPGVYDGLSAHLARRAGFAAVYATGGGIARSMGYPDLGLVSMTEVIARLALIVEHAGVPVIADADTGYGNALNTRRAVRELERAGVAALHLEDQVFPKRCGHYDDKAVVPVAEMQQKLRAAREAAGDPDLVLIARTDALAVEGLDGAVARANAYGEAGADLIFVEAPTTEAQMEAIARRVRHPLLINMFEGGKTPVVPVERLKGWGYRVVIIPSDLQRAAIRGMEEVLAAIRRDGHSGAARDRMASFADRETVIGTAGWLDLDRRYRAAEGAGDR
jgi:2-methylisocitrate lyase-like PEP mutase family enzyme